MPKSEMVPRSVARAGRPSSNRQLRRR